VAKTVTYADVLSMISRNITRGTEDALAATICNLATDQIWNRYDWRESLTVLPPFFPIPNEQDHGTPFVMVPSDFLGLRYMWLSRVDSSPAFKFDPLGILKDLPLTHVRDLPRSVSYRPEVSGFRLFPRFPENIGCPEYVMEGVYKKRPTKITTATLNTLLPFDDLYIRAFLEAMRWAAYDLNQDPRAGATQSSNGATVETGQLAIMNNAIDWMAQDQGLNDGNIAISPAEPLVGSGIIYHASGRFY